MINTTPCTAPIFCTRSRKTHPGPVIHLSDNPVDPNKVSANLFEVHIVKPAFENRNSKNYIIKTKLQKHKKVKECNLYLKCYLLQVEVKKKKKDAV